MAILNYLIIINIVSGALFILDKIKAQGGYRRIPEYQFHFLELFGGVFSIISLMFIIHHKNKKPSYAITSFLILLIWIFFIIYIWSPENIAQ